MTPQESSSKREWVLAALDRYEGPLTRYAQRLLSDEHAARDAVQHAFLRLCEQDPEKLGDRVAAWLFAVCRNKARDAVRRNGREKPSSPSSDASEPGIRDAAGREPEPAAAAEATELAAGLRLLIGRLPAAQREAIDLWCEGFSNREIGEITERSEGAVRVLVHRALVRLRESPQVKKLFDEAAPGGNSNANGAARDRDRRPQSPLTSKNT